MIRFFAIIVVCFLLPILVYLVYRRFLVIFNSEKKIVIEPPAYKKKNNFPWKNILIAGCVLCFLTMLSLSGLDRSPTDTEYVPAKFENNKIVPHKIVPKTKGKEKNE